MCEISYTYLLGCLRHQEEHVKDVCCCLQTCNSVVCAVVMGLVLGQSLQMCNSVVYICCSDGVSTWAKIDGHIYHGYPVICKSISAL